MRQRIRIYDNVSFMKEKKKIYSPFSLESGGFVEILGYWELILALNLYISASDLCMYLFIAYIFIYFIDTRGYS